jgi:membrane protein
MPLSAWKDIAARTYKRSWDDNVGLVAAGVAFYGFFELVPLLGIIVILYGFAADAQTVVSNMNSLMAILPNDIAALIGEQLMNAVQTSQQAKGVGLVAAVALALYAGTNGAGAIITALDIAYEEKEKRSLARFYLTATAITFGAVLFALAALAATAVVAALGELLPQASPLGVALGRGVAYLVLTLAAAGVAATLYRFAPSREDARWEWITPGSLAAAVTWMLLTVAFGFYVTRLTDYNATYGSLGAIIGLLTWIYLSAYVFVFGAELNSEMEHQTAHDSTTGPPEPMGRRGAWAADNVAEDDEIQDRPEEIREGEKLTQATPDPPGEGEEGDRG